MYIEEKQRKIALSELEEEGWEYVKNYADPKFVKVRKEKPYDEQFEEFKNSFIAPVEAAFIGGGIQQTHTFVQG